MDADEKALRAASFGSVARVYAEYRPGYPEEAVNWLLGTSPGRVLELGAGTGKLTESILALGHDVVATDPSTQMLAELRRSTPTAHTAVGTAESIALPSGSVDAVAAAQAFHWFDLDRALPEIARVLRPGGVLVMLWNVADRKVPWVNKVFSLLGMSSDSDVGEDPVADSDLFAPSERREIRHWQQLGREALLGFCSSNSMFTQLSASEQSDLLDQVGTIYDSYGRGPDGMLLPWTTYCYRSRVTGLPGDRWNDPSADAEETGPIEDDDLDDGLLVDFR
jgi:SAM-dependent methyltransferase